MDNDSKLKNISFASVLSNLSEATTLRFSTAGSVDDGKSTFIGRLLFDSKNIFEDQLRGAGGSLANITDGLKAEREQGITIDVGYRYFSTSRRHYIIADTPGHEQYTRNMATGASTADLTVILVDAKNGVVSQTRRHAFIASLLGVPRFLIAINKMDLVGYSKEVFDKIVVDFSDFSKKLGIKEIRFIPVSALCGDNIVHPSKNMPWYNGETVMNYLETVYVGSDLNQIDFRFPVQGVIRADGGYRGYSGQVVSGSVSVGDEVTVLPSLKRSRVAKITMPSVLDKSAKNPIAFAPMSVAISIDDELDISRGDMIVRSRNAPKIRSELDALVIWMGEAPMKLGCDYIIQHTTREVKAIIRKVEYQIDINSLSRVYGDLLKINEIGRVSILAKQPLFVDSYQRNRTTGSFIIIDPEDFQTVGAGMVLDRTSDEIERLENLALRELHLESGSVSRVEREKALGHRAKTYWFTGLSGSGKSSVAKVLELRLFKLGYAVYRLDGDNVRLGLNRDLGFSASDRKENIRRLAEVAKLFNDAGVTVICAAISPFEADRENARALIGAESFIEIYLSTPLEVCESRDPHSLYKKARSGEILDFTGVSSPYEPPKSPSVQLDTSSFSVEQCVDSILRVISPHN